MHRAAVPHSRSRPRRNPRGWAARARARAHDLLTAPPVARDADGVTWVSFPAALFIVVATCVASACLLEATVLIFIGEVG